MNQTGVVDYNSDLIRKGWMKEGLVQAAAKSFWTPLTGNSPQSVVYQKNDLNAGNGMNVVFDYDGFLDGEGFRGAEQAYGKGESKRKFSDTLSVEFGRYSVNNGRKFKAAEIDALDLTNHSDSRSKLGDLWVRNKDQALFDSAQGFLRGEGNTHFIRPNDRATTGALQAGDNLSFDFLMDLQEILETGRGYSQSPTGIQRMPIETINGKYYFMIDKYQKFQLLRDTKFQNLMAEADTRGDSNRIISATLASMGSLNIVEAPNFFGSSSSNKLFKNSVKRSGLRAIDGSGAWQGTAAYDGTAAVSRGLVLGASALKLAFGYAPDYKFQESQDFGIDSESAMEIVYNVDKAQLVAEDEDYDDYNVAGYDFGVIAVETAIAEV